MLHARFLNRRPCGSGEEDFLNVFGFYSHGGHFGHKTIIYINFHSPVPRIVNIKMDLIGRGVAEKIKFAI